MDRYDAVLWIAIIVQAMGAARIVPELVRVVCLLMLAWPLGVWWLRQVHTPRPLWSAFCFTAAFGTPILQLIRLRFLWGQG